MNRKAIIFFIAIIVITAITGCTGQSADESSLATSQAQPDSFSQEPAGEPAENELEPEKTYQTAQKDNNVSGFANIRI